VLSNVIRDVFHSKLGITLLGNFGCDRSVRSINLDLNVRLIDWDTSVSKRRSVDREISWDELLSSL